jgi:ssDNA-binding Zn-finger/Zn-ribbon topoisomerase 1
MRNWERKTATCDKCGKEVDSWISKTKSYYIYNTYEVCKQCNENFEA